ncbi:MAG: DUF1330 domain-containing protein [Rhizobiaceae bacterium]|nr:DUF1330 domain-containing protein [Rhizobiaceae bacterium]MCV0408164.1 DUF1330 domain-containing protein [Rhizobiaceae bacterium]
MALPCAPVLTYPFVRSAPVLGQHHFRHALTRFNTGSQDVVMGDDIVAYLQGIDATLEPFGGRFLVHGGGDMKVLEGELPGDLIVIAFPDRAAAEGWYASAAYRDILPLRTRNSKGVAVLIDGVDADHKATDVLG